MKKRIGRRVLLITVLVMLTGCASIQARVSSCQQLLANTFSASNQIPRQEHQALLTFYKATHGGNNPPTTGTFPCKSMMPPCQWSGVTCVSGHVTQFVYAGSYLSGGIPPELGNLSQLKVLVLSNNNLTGEIPAELGNLSQLQTLRLSGNQLSREIPAELGNLSQLTLLDLADNQLSGEIPAELGNLSELEMIYLSNNQLSGPIPPEFGNLSQLKHLQLAGNELCIPQNAEFEAWMAGIGDHVFEEVPYCE